jgi:FixJ family two-component response regulator
MNSDTGHVFLVDDDESVRRSLERLLRSAGHTVDTFASANDFLDHDSPNTPACAILDLAMPGMDGLELQRCLCAEDLPVGVIFLTGHGDIPTSVQAMKQGAVDFLTKPVDEADLLLAIDTVLREQRQLQENQTKLAKLHERFTSLSPRERQVMELIVTGLLNKQAAAKLGIREKTVKAHRAQVMKKTGARTIAELVQLYISANVAGD